ncbi:MAG: hypothetical protein Tsb0020_23040 [Haliangiales bacterium]
MSIANRRRREREERRFCILDAAESVFADKGFDRATMDDIASEAELSKGTLYLYFKNKDDLLMSLASRSIEAVVEDLEAIARAPHSAGVALRAVLRKQAAHLTSRPQMFRIMIGQFLDGVELDTTLPSFNCHRDLIGRIMAVVASLIKRGKQDGTMRVDIDPVQMAAQLWSGVIGAVLMHLNAERMACRMPYPIDFAHFVDGFIETICCGLHPTNGELSS